MPQLTTLDLQYVSPALLQARNLELAVPGKSSMRRWLAAFVSHVVIYATGTYQSSKPVIKIMSFATKLTVIASKQRPRRLSLKGSDGKDYQYVLKGKDELVSPLDQRFDLNFIS